LFDFEFSFGDFSLRKFDALFLKMHLKFFYPKVSGQNQPNPKIKIFKNLKMHSLILPTEYY